MNSPRQPRRRSATAEGTKVISTRDVHRPFLQQLGGAFGVADALNSPPQGRWYRYGLLVNQSFEDLSAVASAHHF